jgi:hypothetical protein
MNLTFLLHKDKTDAYEIIMMYVYVYVYVCVCVCSFVCSRVAISPIFTKVFKNVIPLGDAPTSAPIA